MNAVDEKVKDLIEALKTSDTYTKYISTRDTLKEEPGLKDRVDAYRARNYELQNMEDDGHLAERIEAFAAENAGLSEQPRVRAFLDAELALCRMLQEITDDIIESIDFE